MTGSGADGSPAALRIHPGFQVPLEPVPVAVLDRLLRLHELHSDKQNITAGMLWRGVGAGAEGIVRPSAPIGRELSRRGHG